MPGKRRYVKNDAGLYMCPECDYTSAKSSTLCMHLNKHDKERENKCKFCDKIFGQKQTLEKHLERFSGRGDHPALKEKEGFECPCDTCEFTSSSKGNCRTHFMRVHVAKETNALLEKGDNSITCKTCRDTFDSSGLFYYHSVRCVSLPITDIRHRLLAGLL
jgi:hypothetical protein